MKSKTPIKTTRFPQIMALIPEVKEKMIILSTKIDFSVLQCF